MSEDYRTTAEHALDMLYAHAKRIADANDDAFRIIIYSSAQRGGKLTYIVSLVETTDSHIFVETGADTLTEAATNADAELKAACEEWDYKYVE